MGKKTMEEKVQGKLEEPKKFTLPETLCLKLQLLYQKNETSQARRMSVQAALQGIMLEIERNGNEIKKLVCGFTGINPDDFPSYDYEINDETFEMQVKLRAKKQEMTAPVPAVPEGLKKFLEAKASAEGDKKAEGGEKGG